VSKPLKVNRRQFIATTGAASLSLAAGQPLLAAAGCSAKDRTERIERSNASLAGSIAHASGVPLGGIGAGSVEIRSDGYFHDWLIFNLGSWAPDQPKEEQGYEPSMPPGALSFFVRTEHSGNAPQLRRLGVREDQNDLYSLGWAKNVKAIAYDGFFPIARLEYLDDSLPIETSAEFFSPFIPHDSQTSGTPGFTGAFRMTNRSSQAVKVSLLAALQNPIASGNAERKLVNELKKDSDGAAITMRTECAGPRKSTLGSMSVSLSGGKPSWILSDFRQFLSNGNWFPTKHYGTVQDNFLRGFRDTGELPSLSGSTSPTGQLLMSDDDIAKLSSSEKNALIEQLSQYPSLKSVVDRVRTVDPHEFDSDEGKTRILQALKSRLDRMAHKRSDAEWGDSALCVSHTFQPGETKEFRFALAWYFPHHFSGDGPEMGHMYGNWFADAEAVNRFLREQFDNHAAKVRDFANTLSATNQSPTLANAWSEQLSTLTKCTWWTKAGRFGVWEGLGCCGFHTMDITYQGSFSILALFPDLQKTQMKMGSDFQRADGRVAHFFTPDLMHVDNSFDRVDMNMQFAMLVCRDYMWTGDKEYLNRLFPHVARAIKNSAQLDSKGIGLPDHNTKLNTYDNWDFYGTPSYISSLWLGALLAGERMARDLGHHDLAEEWKSLREKGIANFEKMLWNGEYYSLWVDGANRDECCMSDQLSGEWFTHLIGMGETLPRERVREVLKSIVRHNFSSETGLVNATYPAGRQPKFSTHMNAQATANWTGIEYAFASMLFDFGMPNEAHTIVESIADRYRRAGRVWNHVECGDHYYRAMSSWSTLLAATGFRVDAPNGIITILPAVADIKAPWVSSTGYGTLQLTKKNVRFACREGSMTFNELRLPPSSKVSVASLPAKFTGGPDYLTVKFESPVQLGPGSELLCS